MLVRERSHLDRILVSGKQTIQREQNKRVCKKSNSMKTVLSFFFFNLFIIEAKTAGLDGKMQGNVVNLIKL